MIAEAADPGGQSGSECGTFWEQRATCGHTRGSVGPKGNSSSLGFILDTVVLLRKNPRVT